MVAKERTEQMENAALNNDEHIMEAQDPPLPRIAAFPALGERIAALEIELDIAEDGRHIARLTMISQGVLRWGKRGKKQ